MSKPLTIAPATLADAPEVAAIYAHHVIHGLATWELEPPSVEEMSARMSAGLAKGWPWLAARDAGGALLGYAYVGQLKPREGYLHSCENSIYVAQAHIGKGVGTALLAALIDASEAAGFRQMVALIAGSEPASLALHARFGFEHRGELKSVGRKHGQWLDLVQMQRALGEGDTTAPHKDIP
jgi:phosphinothricin acetyltransferase